MNIKIKRKVMLKKKLDKYSDNKKEDMRIYEAGEIIKNVNNKYFERFSKAKSAIEISDYKEDTDQEKDYKSLKKSELIEIAKEKKIKIPEKAKKEDILDLING